MPIARPTRRIVAFAAAFAGLVGLAAPGLAVSTVGATTLTDDQRAAVNRLSQTINAISTMQGRFVQIGPSGERAEGFFVLHRPGRLLFRYLPPMRLQIIADGQGLLVRDDSAGTHDIYPIGQTPLRFLLEGNIDLLREGHVLGVSASEEAVTILIEETSAAGTGRVAISTDPETGEIREWTVTDPQGLDTTVALFEIEYGKPTDPNWFYIDHAFRPER